MSDSKWDSYWAEEKKLNHWQQPAESVIEFARNHNSEQRPQVLDLGCGIGRHAVLFAEEGFEVTAVDNFKLALQKLESNIQELNLDIKIVEGNYLDSIFAPDSFDIIVSYNVIYHGYRENLKKR